MDPLTALFNAIEKGFELFKVIIEGQPPEVKAELWKMHLEDVKAWREFWAKFKPKEPN